MVDRSIEACEAGLATLHPVVRAVALRHILLVRDQGLEIRALYGYRPIEDHRELFLRGRALVGGEWKVVNPALVATPVMRSWHCYGLAYCLEVCTGGRPVWTSDAVDLVRSLGITSGAAPNGYRRRWKQPFHFDVIPPMLDKRTAESYVTGFGGDLRPFWRVCSMRWNGERYPRPARKEREQHAHV